LPTRPRSSPQITSHRLGPFSGRFALRGVRPITLQSMHTSPLFSLRMPSREQTQSRWEYRNASTCGACVSVLDPRDSVQNVSTIISRVGFILVGSGSIFSLLIACPFILVNRRSRADTKRTDLSQQSQRELSQGAKTRTMTPMQALVIRLRMPSPGGAKRRR
jgi:hypothetical protein